MQPAQLTFLFAEYYWNQYLSSYKETKDVRTVDRVAPFTPRNIFESDDLTAMWLARQAADSIGCKYFFYLSHVFNVFTSRGWKNLPRPNQIYSEELVISVTTAWKQRCIDVLQIAESSFYTASAYVSHPDQIAYYQYLQGHINKRSNRHIVVAALLEKEIIPRSLAIELFGADICNRALMI
jgi:hypothetical protein